MENQIRKFQESTDRADLNAQFFGDFVLYDLEMLFHNPTNTRIPFSLIHMSHEGITVSTKHLKFTVPNISKVTNIFYILYKLEKMYTTKQFIFSSFLK